MLYEGATLTNAVDFGSIGFAALGPQRAAGMGLIPGATDGFARVKGDDWGVGATAGVSYEYCPNSQLPLDNSHHS